jgi:hypothetical protein
MSSVTITLFFSLQGLILFYFQQVLRVHNIQEANEGKASIATCSNFYHLSLLVISDLASGMARNPPLMAATIIINELFCEMLRLVCKFQ